MGQSASNSQDHSNSRSTRQNVSSSSSAQQEPPSSQLRPSQPERRRRVLRWSTRAQRTYSPIPSPSPSERERWRRRRRPQSEQPTEDDTHEQPTFSRLTPAMTRLLTHVFVDAALTVPDSRRDNQASSTDSTSQGPSLGEHLQPSPHDHGEDSEHPTSFFRLMHIPMTTVMSTEDEAMNVDEEDIISHDRPSQHDSNDSTDTGNEQREQWPVARPVYIISLTHGGSHWSHASGREESDPVTPLRRSERIRERRQHQQQQQQQEGLNESQHEEEAMAGRFLVYIISGNLQGDFIPENMSYEDLLALASMIGPARLPTTSQEDIDSHVPIQKFDAIVKGTMIGNQEECAVCKDEYQPQALVRVLTCHHGFHKECIDRWLTESQNRCPLCRDIPVPTTS